MQSRIVTERLVLSRLEEMDVSFLAFCINDADAHGSFLSSRRLTKEEIIERFNLGAYWNDDSKTYIIKLRNDRTRIGIIHYWLKPDDHQIATYAVQIALSTQRNLGYGTEAQLAMTRMLFTQSRIKAIEIYTDMQNLPEIRVLEKLGFALQQTETYTDLDIERTGHLFQLRRDVFANLQDFL